MGTIVSTVRVGQKIPKEALKAVKEAYKKAKNHPPVYDPECPPSTPETLAEFAAMAREIRKNRKKTAPVVALRLKPDVLSKYKALGKGYTSIMTDVLDYVANNPEILSKART
jgi:uncharacterized protein (DUF4415 family)